MSTPTKPKPNYHLGHNTRLPYTSSTPSQILRTYVCSDVVDKSWCDTFPINTTQIVLQVGPLPRIKFCKGLEVGNPHVELVILRSSKVGVLRDQVRKKQQKKQVLWEHGHDVEIGPALLEPPYALRHRTVCWFAETSRYGFKRVER